MQLSQEEKANLKVLAIDLGMSKVGFATNYGSLAEPLEVIPRAEAVQRLVALVAEHAAQYILIGRPDGPMAEEVQKFVAHLETKLSIPIIQVDETLSSHDAEIIKRSRAYQKRKLPDDAIAAALILESWLELDE